MNCLSAIELLLLNYLFRHVSFFVRLERRGNYFCWRATDEAVTTTQRRIMRKNFYLKMKIDLTCFIKNKLA